MEEPFEIVIRNVLDNRITIQPKASIGLTLQNVLDNQITLQPKSSIGLTLQRTAGSVVNFTKKDNIAVSLTNQPPISINFTTRTVGSGTAFWGTISGTITNQTDLVTYVADQIANIPAPATPTLQSVTDEGNTTTNSIGIGTSTPSALLEIKSSSANDFLKLTTTGSSASPVKLIFEKSAVEQGVIEFNRNGDFEIYNTDNDGGVLISGSGSATADMYINNAGNVGIGTTAPDSKLQINGTAMRQFCLETAGGPSSNTDTSGREGDMAYDADFFYIKTSNGWGRVPLDFGF
jgi:hypothetical protein